MMTDESYRDERLDSVVSSVFIQPTINFKAKHVRDLGILLCIIGVCNIILGFTAIFIGCFMAFICTPIWSGIVIIIGGVFAIRSELVRRSNRVWYAMVSSTIVCMCALLTIIHASIALSFEKSECWVFYCNCIDLCHVSEDIRLFVDAV
ncbi:uncharacterized protein LOC144350830, partial [Saccoglossus kowalevskii]